MENLVPLGTGNSRLMKSNIPASTTLAQLIQMLNNGTFPYDIGPLNSAGISQQGTPLNKDTLFSAQTQAKYPSGIEDPDGALDWLKDNAGAVIGTYPAAVDITAGDVCDVVDGEATWSLTASVPDGITGIVSDASRTNLLVFSDEYSIICYFRSQSLYFATVRNSDGEIVKTNRVLKNNAYYDPRKIAKINENVFAVVYNAASQYSDSVGLFRFDSATGTVTHIKSFNLYSDTGGASPGSFCRLSDTKVLIAQMYGNKIYAAVATISADGSTATLGDTVNITKSVNSAQSACASIALDVVERSGSQYTVIGAFYVSGTANSIFSIHTIKINGDIVTTISDSLLQLGSIELNASLTNPIEIFASESTRKAYFPANVDGVLSIYKLNYAENGTVSLEETYTNGNTITVNIQSRRVGNYIYIISSETINSIPTVLSLYISNDGNIHEEAKVPAWINATNVSNPLNFSMNERIGLVISGSNFLMLEVMRGILGYDISFSSTQAIALNSASPGEDVRLLFGGSAALTGATAGTEIVSDGIIGEVPIDGMVTTLSKGIRNSLTQTYTRSYTGSYTGTGTYGSDNPNTLTFPFTPKIWGIYAMNGTALNMSVNPLIPWGVNDYIQWTPLGSTNLRPVEIRATFSGNTVSWYSSANAANQDNLSGGTYSYFALA